MKVEMDDSKLNFRKTVVKASKATVKGTLFLGIYFFLSQFLAPIFQLVPGSQQIIESFVIGYFVLIIANEFAADTSFQHLLNAAKALFVTAILVYSLQNGIISFTYGEATLSVDIRMFLVIATMLSLLGLAKTVLEAIGYASEKAEFAAYKAN
jgi:hypothetical protein